jgi:hypothetical protein
MVWWKHVIALLHFMKVFDFTFNSTFQVVYRIHGKSICGIMPTRLYCGSVWLKITISLQHFMKTSNALIFTFWRLPKMYMKWCIEGDFILIPLGLARLNPFGTSATIWPVVTALWWWFVEQSVEWELTGKTKAFGENVPQCLFVHHKSRTAWPEIKPGPP